MRRTSAIDRVMSARQWACCLTLNILCLSVFAHAHGVSGYSHAGSGVDVSLSEGSSTSVATVSGRKTLASVTDSANSGGSQCTPYPLPNGVSSYQDWCRQLSTADDSHWNKIFKNASGPPAPNAPLPLHGCVLGCMVGRNSYQRGVNWGAGAWSGKCIQNGGMGVVNLVSSLPLGYQTVLNQYNWSDSLPAEEKYPGTVATGTSKRLSGSWVLNYKDSSGPNTNGVYAQIVKGSQDEVRQIAPGFMIGNVLTLPFSYPNLTPVELNSGIRFVLIQVCDSNGNFPATGNDRDLKA